MFKKVIITSGPTIEPIDPVRFISNRSSGKTGFYLAEEAKIRGIEKIIFITGPSIMIPEGVDVFKIETAQEMRHIIFEHAHDAEVIIMAAAVCDYKSFKYYPEKLKKNQKIISLRLVRNPDILRELGKEKKPDQLLVGFAAETENIFESATKKLKKKNLDLLVLNEISRENPAFGSDENQVFLITPFQIKSLKKMTKAKLARRIWDEIINLK